MAVIERQGQRRWVLAANAAARAANVLPMQDVSLALVHEPVLRCVDRSLSQERKALQGLAAWAHQWSGEVTLEASRWLLALEVGASLRYFGDLTAVETELRTGAATLGYTVQLGVAPTWEAAALLACSSKSATIRSHAKLVAELAHRPLTELALGSDVHGHLQHAGLRTIDDVLTVPRDALARRFSPALTDYLQRLLGERSDPRPHVRIAERYRRTIDCAYPVDTAPPLLFPLHRMLLEFQGYLRGRDMAIESLHVVLGHRHAEATALELRMSSPQRDAALLLPLLRERLERTVIPEPVTQIVLAAPRFVAPAIAQGDLFEDRTALDARWSQLLDRLRARLGEAAIRELHLLDDHRPERAWCIERTDFVDDPQHPLPERPVWILNPRPLRQLPKLLGHPERIEAGWWEGEDQRRDYYVAETTRGALWWVYRDLRTDEWFLHGIWA